MNTTPPQHTSPEKDYSHYHCWDQDQPPACGIPMEKHEQCCLCDLKQEKTIQEGLDRLYTPSFTEKTLQQHHQEWYRLGKKHGTGFERTRILTLIERTKHVYRTSSSCRNALTSLAAELQDA